MELLKKIQLTKEGKENKKMRQTKNGSFTDLSQTY